MFINNSIYRRILVFFLVFVVVPIILITSLLFSYINTQTTDTALAASKQMSQQLSVIVEAVINHKVEMMKNLSSYNELTVFLNNPYRSKVDLSNYNNNVVSFFEGATGTYYKTSIRLYVTNQTIPQGHGTFYPIEQIESLKVISEFIASDEKLGIYSDDVIDDSNYSNTFLSTGQNIIFLYKIFNFDKLSAIVLLKVPEEEFLGKMESHLITNGSLRIMNYTSYSEEELTKLDYSDDYGIIGSIAYSKCDISLFPYTIIITSYIQDSTWYTDYYKLAIVVIIMFGSLFMLYEIYKLTSRIYGCLNRMDESVRSNFTTKLPVKGNDEIASISKYINVLLDEIKKLMKRTVEQETLGKQTHIYALQNQINPHFIYNTLEIFSSQMELYGHYDESEVMSDFAKMLRYNLSGNVYFASIREEIGHMKNYISIQRVRHPWIVCEISIPDELYECKIIRFLFQPLVENSILHGLDREKPELHINIAVKKVNDDLCFKLTDNGVGIDPTELEKINSNLNAPISSVATTKSFIGLANINNRLRLFFGNEYNIQVESHIGQGTIIRFNIPIYNG